MLGKEIKLPHVFLVYQVFYLLRGSPATQDQFFQLQITVLMDRFSFQFSTNNLDTIFSMTYHNNKYTQLDNKKRTWLLNPSRSHTLKHISRDAPSDVSDNHLEPKSKAENDVSRPKTSGTHPDSLKITPSPSPSFPNSKFKLNC